MIRSRNCDNRTQNEFAQNIIALQIDGGASLAAVKMAGVRIPFAGTILSAHIYAATITDADDSVRIDLHKNGASILSATVDPVAADTTTALSVTTAGADVAAGDVLKGVLTTGVGDAFVGTITIVIRPDLGSEV